MRVLVAYASRAGSTRGIAEFIGEKLRGNGIQTDMKEVSSSMDPGDYDAFVIGSAVYQYHWLKEAKEFVSKNRAILASRPVWVFSSGPTGPSETDKKGRSLREVDAPKERDEIRESIKPRDHHIFFGAFFPERINGAMGFFARMAPKEDQGDFRNWAEIETWANGIARALSVPTGVPGSNARGLKWMVPDAAVAWQGRSIRHLMPESTGRKIPDRFLDLINCPRVAALTTVMPDGSPHTTVVWCNYDGVDVLVNTMKGFRKESNMRLNPKVTLLCYDPSQPLRSLEVRGKVVEMTEDGAMEHLDRLTESYIGKRPYFGNCVPIELKETEVPVLCRILPTRVVTLDARPPEVPAR